MVSGSSVGRVVLCPAAGYLAQDNRSGKAAQAGTAFHAAVAHQFEAIPGYVPFPDQPDIETLKQWFPFATALSEHGFWYQPGSRRSKHLGRVLGRAYGKPPGKGWVPMTLDLHIFESQTKTFHDLDIKTGTSHGLARDSWQLKVHALAGAAFYDADSARVGFAVPIGGEEQYEFDTVLYSLDELVGFDEELKDAMKLVEDRADPRPSEEACKWCPSYRHCPASTALTRSITSVGEQEPGEMTNYKAAAGWLALVKYEALLKSLREELEAYARYSPITLPSGKIVKEISEQREYALPIALQKLATLVGAGPALEAATTSKTAIEAVLRAQGESKGWVKEQMEVLRSSGAFAPKTIVSVRAVKP